jgi:hypothetical protein
MLFKLLSHKWVKKSVLTLYCLILLTCRNPGSSVSIVSEYGLDDRAIGVRFPTEAKDTGCGAHSASCTMGTGGPFPGSKARPGRDADHSPPSSAEVKDE